MTEKIKPFRLHILNKKINQQQIMLLKSFLDFWIKTLLKNCLMLTVLLYPLLVSGHYYFLKDEIVEGHNYHLLLCCFKIKKNHLLMG